MQELYQKLFDACSNEDGFDSMAHFVSMKGVHYDENELKFLLIGWAPNGWDPLLTINKEVFGLDAERQFNNIHRFRWIEEINGALYSINDRELPISKRYCLSKKHYWIKAKEVWRQLSNNTEERGIWQENIAWTNLYKIAPNTGNDPNPDEHLRSKQLEVCKEILTEEIRNYKPTHILIFSGYDVWFEPFKDVFEEVVDRKVRNISKGPNKNDVYVEATARIGKAKVVVSCRPEYRDTEPFVKQIIEAFDSIKV